MKGLLGKKIGMTSVFSDRGSSISCTLIEAGPCYVTAVRTKEDNGYSAVQLGFVERKPKGLSKPLSVYFKKKGLPNLRYIKEVRE